MTRKTDLLRVKLVAHTLLDVQIQKTSFSPVIVSHPFTNSGISALRNEDGSLSMVDLINNSDDCTRWRRKVGEQIDSAENVHQIFALLNPPYYLTFIKFAASALSEQDLGQLLSTAWTQEECPNQDCNVSKQELVALFRSVSPESLMDEEECTAHQALEDTVPDAPPDPICTSRCASTVSASIQDPICLRAKEVIQMKNNEITVLKVEPGKAPETVTIPNTLEAAQKMVGGYIEVLNVDNACLVCNEDGKLTGLEGNRRLGNDIITGTFFLTGCTDDGDFCSLTPEQMEHFTQRFAQPETFQPGEVENAFRFEFYSM